MIVEKMEGFLRNWNGDNENDTLPITVKEMREIFSIEQEPILDKIRAEIMDTGAYEQETKGRTKFLEGINYCLGVIDKYKSESEG